MIAFRKYEKRVLYTFISISFEGSRYFTPTTAKFILTYSRLLTEARMAGDLNITSVSKKITRKPIDDSQRLLRVYHTDTLESLKANKTLDRRPISKEILLYLWTVPSRSRKK